MTGTIQGQLTNFDLAVEKKNQDLMLAAIQQGLVASSHDCSEGGLAVAIAEAAFANGLGVKVQVELTVAELFSETQSRFVVSINSKNQTAFEQLAGEQAYHLGEVTADSQLRMQAVDGEINLTTQMAKASWEEAIPCLMK
ncbi:hypothetical protein K4E_25690 [Enterococcus thailandicus]|nr:hypothetical protein K4E_25690 [Enterococcus thailandicus]